MLRWYLLAVVMLGGCVAQPVAEAPARPPNRLITDFQTLEDSRAVTVVIKGNQPLRYTAARLKEPLGLRLQFPETALDGLKAVYYPPPNSAIRSIRSTESGGEVTVFFDLLQDLAHEVAQEAGDLKISFAKPEKPAKPAAKPPVSKAGRKAPPAAPAAPVAPVAPAAPAVTSAASATLLKNVTVAAEAERSVIRVTASGAVKQVKDFTMDKPARIVFDLMGLRSNEGEQRIAVNSGWLREVRYSAHPDRVRIVAESSEAKPAPYSLEWFADGVLITIGK